LAVDLKLLKAAEERIATAETEAEAEAGDRVSRADTLLVVVGRGTNDPDANSNVSKITRMLWEGMGFGWAETCYSGVTQPLVIDAFLERLDEIPRGDNLMNCQLCKYREQIIGYEKDQGAAQVGHHHHVEGIGTDADHHHPHDEHE
jgi:sirohydrochlorin ferrochelatase